jgi:hypothetical protein
VAWFFLSPFAGLLFLMNRFDDLKQKVLIAKKTEPPYRLLGRV